MPDATYKSRCLTSVFPLLTQAFHHAIPVSVVIPGSVGEENHTYHTSRLGELRFEGGGGRRERKKEKFFSINLPQENWNNCTPQETYFLWKLQNVTGLSVLGTHRYKPSLSTNSMGQRPQTWLNLFFHIWSHRERSSCLIDEASFARSPTFNPLTKAHCNFSTASPHTHPSPLTFWPLAPIQRANYNEVISQHKTPLRLGEFCYNRISHSLIINDSFYLWNTAKQDSRNLTNLPLPPFLQKNLFKKPNKPQPTNTATPHTIHVLHLTVKLNRAADCTGTWEVPPVPYLDLHGISQEASLG